MHLLVSEQYIDSIMDGATIKAVILIFATLHLVGCNLEKYACNHYTNQTTSSGELNYNL